ncbi:hypothetical protein RSJ42_07155 [Methanosarcina hadiensis]|uniref:hypothetical protein n=1 Tax=Methanosarcina hadiensis TaxID=3078083 RepID=UPI003977408F
MDMRMMEKETDFQAKVSNKDVQYLETKALIGDTELINEIHQKFFKSSDVSYEKFLASVSKLKNHGDNFIHSLVYVSKCEQMTEYSDPFVSQKLPMLILFISIEILMSEEEDKSSNYLFEEWVVSSKKEILGKCERDNLLKDTSVVDIEKFNKLIKELYGIYMEEGIEDSEKFEDWLISSKNGIIREEKKIELLENTSIIDIKRFKKLINDLSSLHKEKYGTTNRVRSFFKKYLSSDQKKGLITSITFKDKISDKYVYKCFEPKKCSLPEDISFEFNGYRECLCYEKCKHSKKCRLENNIDEVMEVFAGFLYGYYRSSFAHFGKTSLVSSKAVPTNMDTYKGKAINIHLEYNDLKAFITSGIINYYFQNCEFEFTSNE